MTSELRAEGKRFAIVVGTGARPRIEFYDDPLEVNRRLNHLWAEGHTEARGRLTNHKDHVLGER